MSSYIYVSLWQNLKEKLEIELTIRRPQLMLTYPAHFHNPIIPKGGLSARPHYTFKKADTLSDPLPTNKDFI